MIGYAIMFHLLSSISIEKQLDVNSSSWQELFPSDGTT